MFSLFKWIQRCIKYVVFGKEIKEELVNKINDETNEIPENIKQDLMKSIIENNPEKFIEQIDSSKLTDKAKTDLMNSILNAPTIETKNSVSTNKLHEHEYLETTDDTKQNIVEQEIKKDIDNEICEQKDNEDNCCDYSDMPPLEFIDNKNIFNVPTLGIVDLIGGQPYCESNEKLCEEDNLLTLVNNLTSSKNEIINTMKIINEKKNIKDDWTKFYNIKKQENLGDKINNILNKHKNNSEKSINYKKNEQKNKKCISKINKHYPQNTTSIDNKFQFKNNKTIKNNVIKTEMKWNQHF